MKKRLFIILAAISILTFTGCSNKKVSESNTQTESITESADKNPSADSMEETPMEAPDELKTTSVITGTVDELKDFMIVITDDTGAAYALDFEDKPEGIDKVKVGDTVSIEYTGVLSEIDPFSGTILSVSVID